MNHCRYFVSTIGREALLHTCVTVQLRRWQCRHCHTVMSTVTSWAHQPEPALMPDDCTAVNHSNGPLTSHHNTTRNSRRRFWHATQDCIAPYVDHILHRDQFWAIYIASGSVRLWYLRSCCMVLSLVIWGRPCGLLQSSRGRVDRILLASTLSAMHTMCSKRVRWRDWTIAVSLGPVSLLTSSFQKMVPFDT